MCDGLRVGQVFKLFVENGMGFVWQNVQTSNVILCVNLLLRKM